MCSFKVSKEVVLDDMFTFAMMQTPFVNFYEFYALSESLSCYRLALPIKRQGSMKNQVTVSLQHDLPQVPLPSSIINYLSKTGAAG